MKERKIGIIKQEIVMNKLKKRKIEYRLKRTLRCSIKNFPMSICILHNFVYLEHFVEFLFEKITFNKVHKYIYIYIYIYIRVCVSIYESIVYNAIFSKDERLVNK